MPTPDFPPESKNESKLFMRFLLLVLTTVILSGCYTSQVAPDVVDKANEHLDHLDSEPPTEFSVEERTRLSHLFSDSAEYAELVSRQYLAASLPRLRTATPPKYPLVGYIANTKATIKVAFVISETGNVEDARIYEASDDRFSASAREAVLKWTFYPGTINGTPAKFLFIVPVQFDGRQ